MKTLTAYDSHTAGEPTRMVLNPKFPGMPEPFDERVDFLRGAGRTFLDQITLEPRGSDVIVGALVWQNPGHPFELIFFNNATVLGMCGHGTIGVVRTLGFLGMITPGKVEFQTPVGSVEASWGGENAVSVANVTSFVYKSNVTVSVPGFANFIGDIAWGGNWFFLVEVPEKDLTQGNIPNLMQVTIAIKEALAVAGITGDHEDPIDHVELYCSLDHRSPSSHGAHSKNFVLCPGDQFDRSPCGTGTSAKMALLAFRGKLEPGTTYHQMGILGTQFKGEIEWAEGRPSVLPRITGEAFLTSVSELQFEPNDPFLNGICYR